MHAELSNVARIERGLKWQAVKDRNFHGLLTRTGFVPMKTDDFIFTTHHCTNCSYDHN